MRLWWNKNFCYTFSNRARFWNYFYYKSGHSYFANLIYFKRLCVALNRLIHHRNESTELTHNLIRKVQCTPRLNSFRRPQKVQIISHCKMQKPRNRPYKGRAKELFWQTACIVWEIIKYVHVRYSVIFYFHYNSHTMMNMNSVLLDLKRSLCWYRLQSIHQHHIYRAYVI